MYQSISILQNDKNEISHVILNIPLKMLGAQNNFSTTLGISG